MSDQADMQRPVNAATAKAGRRVRKAAVQAAVMADTAVAAVQAVAARAAVITPVPVPTPAPAVPAPSLEPVPSPADFSDALPAAAEPAVDDTAEEIETMATVAAPMNPTEATDKAQAFFGDAQTRFKTAFDKSSKIGEDLVEFTKGNVEALVASARVAAKAGESFGQEAADYGKRQFEGATAAFKSFASVKSPTELFQLQSDYAKSSFDSAVAEASRLSESWLKLAGEIAQPLSNRYAVAAEKFKATAL